MKLSVFLRRYYYRIEVNLENKFICPLPWVSLSIGVNNKRRLCCHETRDNIEMTPHELEEVKSLMRQGAIPLACKKCAALEANEILSPRHQYSQDYRNHSQMQYLDLVLNNDCNLECLMCSPAYSVRLNTIYRETSPIEVMPSWSIDYNELNNYDLSGVTDINIIGGEPLLSKDAFLFLENFLKNYSLKKLRIISNFTKLPDRWKSIFDRVEKLELIASIDATEKLYEFIRYPANFEVVKNNIAKLRSWDLRNLHLYQHVVLMNLNFPYMKEILHFYDEFFSTPENRLPVLVEISSPQILHPRVLTDGQWLKAKKDALEVLEDFERKYGIRQEFKDFRSLITKMEQMNLGHFYIDYQIYLQKIKKYHS
ncbi:MAG TPA: twitch domain-containing radical SAM protein [Bacteriovoracaceae bacterium]|nr:twitch domain-containing radical SAM protein [Bacteriovoracaceae bacterium]